jgi:flavin reductase ActVB
MSVTAQGPLSEHDTSEGFRQALAAFPSGVTIVTTVDAEGTWWGFTATSFCALSLRPPLVLVCLALDAQCHPAFTAAASWAVSIVRADHRNLAMRFSTKGVDKFAIGGFEVSGRGLPMLTRACAVLECESFMRHECGDHSILVGRVVEAHTYDQDPAVYFRREFRTLSS